MDRDDPCWCQRCGWLGTVHDAHEYRPDERQAINVCPRCAPEIEVQTLGQKGLDALRQEYRFLPKPGYQYEGNRAERRAQLERFFEHIEAVL